LPILSPFFSFSGDFLALPTVPLSILEMRRSGLGFSASFSFSVIRDSEPSLVSRPLKKRRIERFWLKWNVSLATPEKAL